MYAAPALQPDPTAVVWRRLFAYFIDGLVAFIVAVPFMIGMFQNNVDRTLYASQAQATAACDQFNNRFVDTGTDFNFGSDGFRSSRPFCVSIGRHTYEVDGPGLARSSRRATLIAILLQAFNLVLLQGLTGASIGKWLVGLRVVRPDGSTARLGACTIRWVMLLVDSWCFLIGLLTMCYSAGHRRVGDMVAGTYVVARSSVGHPIVIPGVPHPSAAPVPMAPHPGAPGTPPTAPNAGAPMPPATTATPWPTAPPTAPISTPPAPAPGAHHDDGPHWDPARNTYIRFDRTASAWTMWDANANTWVPISQ